MSTATKITEFVDRTKKLSSNTGLASGISGSTNTGSIMVELYNSAALLHKANAENKLDEQLEEVVSALHVAQAMSVIGYTDLEELMDLLEEIKKEK